jgi:hypothetical protein
VKKSIDADDAWCVVKNVRHVARTSVSSAARA